MLTRTKYSDKVLKSSGIYLILSIRNGKRYIGSTINLFERGVGHYRVLEKGIHPNLRLQNHVNKYGISDLRFSIIEFCTKEKLIEREQYWIDKVLPEFNICKVAGSPLGYKHSEKNKQKIGLASKGRIVSLLTRRKISLAGKGRIVTEETKQRMKVGQKSENCRGYCLSRKTRWKMIQSRKGKNNPFYGKKHTKESKELNRKAHLGKSSYVRTLEQRKLLSERQKGEKGYWFGKRKTEEQKQKISNSLKKTLRNKKRNIKSFIDSQN